VLDAKGSVSQIIEYDLDITEQRWVERQLETESKRARLYLDVLSHDMANQLQVISGCIELIKEACIIPGMSEFAGRIVSQAAEALLKCRNLISKARSTEQLAIVPLVERSLPRVLLDCIEQLGERHESFVVEIVSMLEEALVLADRFLEDLFSNLLDNAIEHNKGEFKHVWVGLRRVGDEYVVCFGDNGPGIDDTSKTDIFDPSQRLGGLGMHFSAEIVEKYGGDIEVRDRVLHKPDEGVKFLVRLPKLGGSTKWK
ncbi:MAG: sensor histidine kinase, partial [Candidatus Thorarchaeota archaeon]